MNIVNPIATGLIEVLQGMKCSGECVHKKANLMQRLQGRKAEKVQIAIEDTHKFLSEKFLRSKKYAI